MKIPLLLAVVVIWLYPAGVAIADDRPVLVIYGDDSNPPFVYLDDEGHVQGTAIALIRYVSDQLPYRPEFQLLPWPRAYDRASNGHGAIIGLSKTTEREARFRYSGVLYTQDMIVVVRKGQAFPFRSIEDLYGKRIAAHQDSNYSDKYRHALVNKLFEPVFTNSRPQRLKLLLYGRVDAALIGGGPLGLAITLASDDRLSRTRAGFEVLDVPLLHDPNFLAIPKEFQAVDMLPLFDRLVAEARRGGIEEDIQSAYIRALVAGRKSGR